MPLTYDQQKNILSLIDNAGAGTYEEVRNELYDHLVQAVEDGMARGSSSPNAKRNALAEMGGEAGLVTIEKGYIKATKRKVWHLFRAFLPVYFKSVRWLLPLALGLTLNLHIWFPLIGISAYVYIFMHKLKAWGYGWGFGWGGVLYQTRTHYPLSLRADVLRQKAIMLVFIPYFSTTLLFGNGLPVAVNIGLATMVLTLIDYSLAFVSHARKNWLEIA